MGDLITTLDRFEPRSASLYYTMAQGFCRIVSWLTLVDVCMFSKTMKIVMIN